jgi:hypothetical protein
MTTHNYQTVRLARGKHRTPADGACVVELASMLAGEPFSDHPDSVCPVIAAVLRAYNDAIDDAARQSLYDYAGRIVGSRSPGVEQARGDRLVAWAREVRAGRFRRRWPFRGIVIALQHDTAAAMGVSALLRRGDRDHADVLELVDELLAMGRSERPHGTPVPTPPTPAEAARVRG